MHILMLSWWKMKFNDKRVYRNQDLHQQNERRNIGVVWFVFLFIVAFVLNCQLYGFAMSFAHMKVLCTFAFHVCNCVCMSVRTKPFVWRVLFAVANKFEYNYTSSAYFCNANAHPRYAERMKRKEHWTTKQMKEKKWTLRENRENSWGYSPYLFTLLFSWFLFTDDATQFRNLFLHELMGSIGYELIIPIIFFSLLRTKCVHLLIIPHTDQLKLFDIVEITKLNKKNRVKKNSDCTERIFTKSNSVKTTHEYISARYETNWNYLLINHQQYHIRSRKIGARRLGEYLLFSFVANAHTFACTALTLIHAQSHDKQILCRWRIVRIS